jgi:hypothetical protein
LSFEECVSTCDKLSFHWQEGRLAEERHEFANGLPELTVKYIRDADSKVVEQQTFYQGAPGCSKRYHASGSREEETEYCSDTPTSRQIRLHDESTGTDCVSLFTYQEDGTTVDLQRHWRELKVQLENGTTRTEKRYSDGTSVTTTDVKGRLLEDVSDFEIR